MTLHVINKTTAHLWRDCITALAANDALLLLEDGVFAAIAGHENQLLLQQPPLQLKLYALAEDLAARGITASTSPIFSSISYREFVALSLAHAKVINWQ
jgi:tRNA 2-thiouridine synthesizing protein B